jgi:2,4-dienoyl-CoA reductase-like NADH-dependent reductase (Old Yellow Enzyme family)
MKQEGVDVVDCSSGALVPDATIPIGPGFQVPFAAQVKKETPILTGAVGLITNAPQAEAILKAGDADFILMARQYLRDPYAALHFSRDLGVNPDGPVQYGRAF